MRDINLGDIVQLEDGRILYFFATEGKRLFGCSRFDNFPRFVGTEEWVLINPKNIKRVWRELTSPDSDSAKKRG